MYSTDMSRITLVSSVVRCFVVQFLAVYFCIFSEFNTRMYSSVYKFILN